MSAGCRVRQKGFVGTEWHTKSLRVVLHQHQAFRSHNLSSDAETVVSGYPSADDVHVADNKRQCASGSITAYEDMLHYESDSAFFLVAI